MGGIGCGVWGFIDFQVVNYLIFREKVLEFSPRSPQWLALFEGKKVQKSYPTRFLDLFSRPYLFGSNLANKLTNLSLTEL
ncbi:MULTISPECIES: hypothetical protein [Microcystis]|uniref:hypothetical protein n=1 Tax=Microcystis TaxID=1125 RepID=UPI002245481E|nr:hypothetical protein [Microcystis aeruginosa]UZO78985.1 hypothetical protein M8120_15565 [Microcystis aeruginosa str. Chao 1910]